MSTTADYMPQEYGEDDYYDDIVDMTPEVMIPSGIGLALLIIVGVSGNVITILAYLTDRGLHDAYHFFILNLAINDLLLCTFSMPFYAVYTLKEFTWPFGLVFCKIWMVIDFTCCLESILLMLILSIDRLLLITLGPQYFQKITMKVAGIIIAVSWFVSFIVYGPCIIGWDYWVGYSTIEPGDCDVEFAYDHTYTIFTSVIEFTLPFIVLTSINVVIFLKIRDRKRRPSVRPSLKETKSNISSSIRPSLKETKSNISSTMSTSIEASGSRERMNVRKDSKAPSTRSIQLKAAKLLTLLVVVFLICWTPYIITTILISICDECVHKSMYEFFNWVLWMKSAVNPFLYAYKSVRYRKRMQKLLTCIRFRSYLPTSEASDSKTSSNTKLSQITVNVNS